MQFVSVQRCVVALRKRKIIMYTCQYRLMKEVPMEVHRCYKPSVDKKRALYEGRE